MSTIDALPLARLRDVEGADRETYEGARRRYLDDPTDVNRLVCAEAARRWALSQEALIGAEG